MSGALREVFAEFGIEFDDRKLQTGARSVGGMIQHVRQLGAVLAGNQIVQGIRAFANEFEESAGRLEDSSAQLGTTTTELQEMQFAATAAGISGEQSTAAFARFQQQIAGAAQGASGPAAAFRALGVSVKDSAGHVGTTSDLFDGAMQALAGIEDPTLRAARAQELFGRAGARLANIAHEGAGGAAALRAEFESLGGGVLPEAVAAAGAYGDANDRMEVAMSSLKSVLATSLMPALTWLVTRVTQGMAAFSRMARGTHVVEVALTALGAAAVLIGGQMLLAWLPVLAPFLATAGAVALLVLLLDDLKTMMEGGDSVIGRWLDSMAGVGTTQRFVQELKDAWEGLNLFIHDSGVGLGEITTAIGEWATEAQASVVEFVTNAQATFDGFLAMIRAAFAVVTDPLRAAFDAVWGAIERTFGISWDRIVGRVTGLLSRIGGALGGIGRALGINELVDAASAAASSASSSVTDSPAVATARDTAAGIAQVFTDVRDEWRDVFNGQNQALVPAAPAGATAAPVTVTAPASARAPRVVTQHRTTHNRVQINGATDPQATAAAVDRRLTDRERAQRDADHPVTGGG